MSWVSDSSFFQALSYEKRILELPKDSGIIFASVQAVPEENGISSEFNVVVGLDRKFSKETGESLLREIFRKEISDGRYKIATSVFRGSEGPATNKVVDVTRKN